MTTAIPAGSNFIDGFWQASDSGRTWEVFDPATGTVAHRAAWSSAADVHTAVASANAAAPAWAETNPSERGALLGRWVALVRERFADLAALESSDVGKPGWGGEMNIAIASGIIEYFAGAADKLTGVTLPTRTPEFFGYTRMEPLGTCAVIIPWNVPAVLAAANIAPALAAGNTVVLKPSEIAPLVPLALVELAHQAGIPAGVLNAVTGDGATTGAALTSHPGINHISFVGSTATGRTIMRAAADLLVPVKLELGGKSPNIVFDDAPLDSAVAAIVGSITENAGQNCYAGSRLLIQESVAAEVTERVVEAMRAVRVGSWDENPDMGPLVSAAQHDRVRGFVAAAPSQGGTILTGGVESPAGRDRGYFVSPTVIAGGTDDSPFVRQEIFGPVLSIQTFTDDADALRIANGSEFGLLTCLWTRDVSRALDLAARVRSGQVSVNQFADEGVIGFPFNMQKASGFSAGGGYAAMREYTQEKGVAVRLLCP